MSWVVHIHVLVNNALTEIKFKELIAHAIDY